MFPRFVLVLIKTMLLLVLCLCSLSFDSRLQDLRLISGLWSPLIPHLIATFGVRKCTAHPTRLVAWSVALHGFSVIHCHHAHALPPPLPPLPPPPRYVLHSVACVALRTLPGQTASSCTRGSRYVGFAAPPKSVYHCYRACTCADSPTSHVFCSLHPPRARNPRGDERPSLATAGLCACVTVCVCDCAPLCFCVFVGVFVAGHHPARGHGPRVQFCGVLGHFQAALPPHWTCGAPLHQ